VSEWTWETPTKKLKITQRNEPIELDSPEVAASSSAKKYIVAAQQGGFTVNASTSTTFEQGAEYKSGANAGTRRPDREVRHLWISGSALVGRVTAALFLLHYENGKFTEAKLWDRAGSPMQLSDGEFWVNPSPRWVTTALDWEEWLGDLVPSFVPKKRPAPRAKKEDNASLEALLEQETWTP
jgi:hypothetical protein